MSKPSLDDVLRPLKGFQRRTVDHAFERLFLAEDGTSRFLVADEVGLGKTLVARGVIARAVEHLWEEVRRIQIVYVCSNGEIARANLPKLRVGGEMERSYALATRLTELATELAPRGGRSGLLDSKLSLVSLTPSTSFTMGIHGGGRRREREILFQLLHPLVGRWVPLANLLQGRVKDRNGWRDGLRHRPPRIEPTIRVRFSESFESCTDLRRRLDEALNQWFFRYRPHWPDEARWRRNGLIHELRRLLARICLGVLEPDLVILDEFQRFKPLLETRKHHQSEAARLAQELFGAKAHDGRSVRTLLLSATPYKFSLHRRRGD